MYNIGPIIKRNRLAMGVSQKSLAAAVGLSQPRISQIETGDWEPPRASLILIARELQSPEILLEALRQSPIMQEALIMLGVDQHDPDPRILIHRIREELVALEGDIEALSRNASVRAGTLVHMCRMLTLILASAHSR